jgi:hypothetical protein
MEVRQFALPGTIPIGTFQPLIGSVEPTIGQGVLLAGWKRFETALLSVSPQPEPNVDTDGARCFDVGGAPFRRSPSGFSDCTKVRDDVAVAVIGGMMLIDHDGWMLLPPSECPLVPTGSKNTSYGTT